MSFMYTYSASVFMAFIVNWHHVNNIELNLKSYNSKPRQNTYTHKAMLKAAHDWCSVIRQQYPSTMESSIHTG